MDSGEPQKLSHGSYNETNQRMSTTQVNTPSRQPQHIYQHTTKEDKNPQQKKQCPYHFNQPGHVCLTCRRSICLRCAITLCQQHTIYAEEEILPLLLIDLQKLTIDPRVEELTLQLKQSQQRQEYLSRKVTNMLDQVEQHFQYLKQTLDRKKQQIIQYFHKEFGKNGYLGEYHCLDEELNAKINWLKSIKQNIPECQSIEQIDQLAAVIKQHGGIGDIFNSKSKSKAEKKVNKMLTGRDNFKTHKIWSEEKLERILYEIQNIDYKLSQSSTTTQTHQPTKKKRVITEASEQIKLNNGVSLNSNNLKHPLNGLAKSTSNSKFPTGRKIE